MAYCKKHNLSFIPPHQCIACDDESFNQFIGNRERKHKPIKSFKLKQLQATK